MVTKRRKGRILALQALYEINSVAHSTEAALAHLCEEEDLPEEVITFAQELVNGVLQNKARLDDVIQTFASAFPLEQVPIVDRNILRLAIFEILINNKVPAKAVINEAVELAKAFGSDATPKFVNGVLGSLMDSIQADKGSLV